MKKTPISAKLRLILILCCVIVLAVLIYRQPRSVDMGSKTLDIRKDPNAYYDGCVSCTLAIEKRGLLFKRIFVKATFKNETDYPIPLEKRHLFISMEGKPNTMEWAAFEVYKNGEEVWYRGPSIKRKPSQFPQDYYCLPSHATYTALINLSKYYEISKKDKYSVKYYASNSLTNFFDMGKAYGFEIESEPVEFEK